MGTHLELTTPCALISHFNGDFVLLERSMQYAHELLGDSSFVYLGPIGASLVNEARIGLKSLFEQQLGKSGKIEFDSFHLLREYAAGPTKEFNRVSECDRFFMICPTSIHYRESSTIITSELNSFTLFTANEPFFDVCLSGHAQFIDAADPDSPPLRRIFFSTVEGPCAFKDGKRIDVADEMVLEAGSVYFIAPGPLYYPE